MLVRFVDDVGERMGDREMGQVPPVGEVVLLRVVKRDSIVEREFRVARRTWTPDSGVAAILIVEPV